MAVNPYVNKVIYGDTTVIDLTADTAVQNKVLSGYTFHDATGATVTGNCDFDVNSQDADILVGEMLVNKTAYARGVKLTGTMPNRGAVSGTIATKEGTYSVPQGYHDGSGSVGIDSVEKEKIIAGNIKKDIVILGVTGTYEGGEVTAQTKTATPTSSQQVILPDEGYDYLSQVTVNAIPYVETDNAAGGKTATIG